MLSQDRLKELLHYDPETGEWMWAVDRTTRTRAGSAAGCPGKYRYCQIMIDGKLYRAHRLAWLFMTGSWPVDEVGHIDRNGHNNKWTNLREATRAQNSANTRTRNALGVRGVYVGKSGKNPYEAFITMGRKTYYLGMFKTVELASAAYQTASKSHSGEFSAS